MRRAFLCIFVPNKRGMKLIDIKTTSLMVDVKANDATDKFLKLIGRNKNELSIGVDLDKIVKYIVLMYDPRSPMIEIAEDYWMRKFECLDLAGFSQKKGKFTDHGEEVAMGTLPEVNDLIIDFLVQVSKPKWSYVVFLNESIVKYTKQSMGEAMKKADVEAVSALYDKLSTVVAEWLSSNRDETNAFMDRLYFNIHQELVKIRPEAYAKRIIAGDELDDDNPYGKKYKVNKPKFKGSKIPKDGE